jgi:hypothetical protein
MAEPAAYRYVPLITRTHTGQRILVQLFMTAEGAPTIIHAQLAFEDALGRWGVPYQLEVAP